MLRALQHGVHGRREPFRFTAISAFGVTVILILTLLVFVILFLGVLVPGAI